MYKVDLSRAYRQLRSDPLDWPLLEVIWEEDYYVDVAIRFGLRHGASTCQRVSEAAGHVAAHEYGAKTVSYVDDTAGAALPAKAMGHYNGLLSTLDVLGMQTAPAKCEPPSTPMTWVGVTYDSILMQMSIDQDRIDEALIECRAFMGLTKVTYHAIQKFMGKLYHGTKCTVSARAFTARLLGLLRVAARMQVVVVTAEAKADVSWCLSFLNAFNGITLMKVESFRYEAEVDSCLQRGEGICPGLGYLTYPEHMQELGLSISSLDCFNVLVAVRLWVREWSGHGVQLWCDNWATVCSINSSRAEDPLIRSSLRELWWLCAIWDVHLQVRHRPGVQMTVPDLLSRVSRSEKDHAKFRSFERGTGEASRQISSCMLMPPLRI